MNPEQQPTNSTQPTNPQMPTTPITPAEPPKSKQNTLMIAVVVVVLLIIGVVAYIMLSSSKDTSKSSNSSDSTSNNNGSNPTSDKYQKYTVTDKPSGITFSVSFYKDAKVEEKNNRTYLNSGEAGSMYSVYLGVATGDKIDCGEVSTTTMKLGGESTTVCYDSDNTQYAGYAKAKNGLVKINLAGQKPISLDDAKTIMESVTFN